MTTSGDKAGRRGKEADVIGEVAVETGAEGFIELLNVNRVDYIFMNPGTDTTPIQEAIAKFKANGRRTPHVILCPHETVAMAAAHGYFAVTGRPQVVLVHVDVGTQNIGGALHNAQRSRIGVVVCAGRSPSIFEGERPGGRSMGIMWWQEQRDQAGVVRNFTKWDYELRFNENAHHVVQRAFQLAASEPCGPVYLTLPREVLVEKIKKVQVLDIDRFAPPATPEADSILLEKAAGMLAEADNPLIIVGYAGRNPKAVQPLVELAEMIGARVSSSSGRLNFPTTHPLAIGGFTGEFLKQADVVMIVDHDIPYIPAMAKPASATKIIHIDIDPIKQDMVMWGFPSDILLQADSAKAIPALNKLVRKKVTQERKVIVQARLAHLVKERSRLDTEARAAALSGADSTPVSPEWFCLCLSEVVDADTIIVDESMSGGGALARYVPRTKPGTIFGSGGSSLGFGLGASLGVKLAAPDKDVVCLVGDGCFMFGCPTPTFWASSVYHLPFLCVIFNNEGYNAVRSNLRATFGKDNFGEKDPLFAGMDIVPSPDYALIAQACNCYGETVRTSAEAKPAIRRALEQVKGGRSAVLDVRIPKR
jgi:acetolactate synthase-1/2/3 large subunit